MVSRIDQQYGDDWVDRQVEPDVYPRKRDPWSSGNILQPPSGTLPAGADFGLLPGADILKDAITMPGVRPVAYQRALNLSISVTDTPIAIQPGTFQCDAIEISVPSSLTNSTFFGFGSGVTSSSGIEVKPGIPQLYSPDNVREQWELQRELEAIEALLAYAIGISYNNGIPFPSLGQFMAPRVVLNAHDYYLVNASGITQTVAVMLWTVPEYQ